MKKLFFPILAVVALSNLCLQCNRWEEVQPPPEADLGDTVEIGMQQSVFIQPGDFRLTLDSVLDDSRCPLDVICVWEGRADVRMVFALDQTTVTDTLGVGGQGAPWAPDSMSVLGYNIKLIDILPYPDHSGVVIPQNDYKVKVVVTQ